MNELRPPPAPSLPGPTARLPRNSARACFLIAAHALASACAQTVSTQLDPAEPVGHRPYEMVWAKRTEPSPPSLSFDQLAGWRLQVDGGAEASLALTRAQNLWDRPVARLRYRGNGNQDSHPRSFLVPPQPIALPADADCVDAWVYGNRWDWENPPGTPPVRLILQLADRTGKAHEFAFDTVRWQEWWLLHKRLPDGWERPLQLQRIEVAGGWQSEFREIFFDSIRFYREPLEPLRFQPRPARNLRLEPGQVPGANTGPGRLPFPTRDSTILPMHLGAKYRTDATSGNAFRFRYQGADGEVGYYVDVSRSGTNASASAGLARILAEYNGQKVARIVDAFTIKTRHGAGPPVPKPDGQRLDRGIATIEYTDGTILRLQLWQKSLVADVSHPSGEATTLEFGELTDLTDPRLVTVPYLNYGGGPHPCVLLSRAGAQPVFTSLWLDWYRSNGSEPYALEAATNHSAWINGGVRYHPRTDGHLNPMFERVFLTVSPAFEEVLPTVPNPVGLNAPMAIDRLWQESWGPDNFTNQVQRSRKLRAYGIDRLIQCNHEIAWRDGGESFTLRTHAAPKKGGDEALQRYVAHQQSLGWLAGLYSNYTDYAPVNQFWHPDNVQRQSDGNWRSAWPRCWALKPLRAVEFDALLAPQIQQQYRPTSAYTDVHTAVAPWHYNDADARVPGAATFAQTFYAYGELLRNDSQIYRAPVFSEGTYHWLYAGLADGNYALAYDGRPLANEPLLPVFDLYQIHAKECDIGMGWTANFCDAIPDWRKPENLDRAIDRFLLHTLAYGHIGWLVEEEHGIDRTCRSYYLLQQVQARYGLKAPTRIAYWDGSQLRSVSEALVRDLPRTRRQLYLEYPGNLQLWLNDHPTENWSIPYPTPVIHPQASRPANRRPTPGEPSTTELVIPPAGWAALQPRPDLVTYSALRDNGRVDYLRSPEYTFLDGRGRRFVTPEATTSGAIAIRPMARQRLEILRISGDADILIRRPYGTRGRLASAEVFDVDGRPLPLTGIQDHAGETRLVPPTGALRYLLTFTDR